MSLALVIPSYRGGDASPEVWDDLRVCLSAVTAYARGFEVIVAWDGPCAPTDLPANPDCRILRRPRGLRSPQAVHWGAQQTGAEDFITLSDDVVLQPDTLVTLLEDVMLVRRNGYLPGYMAARSNFAPGPQNVRAANEGTWGGGVVGYTSEQTVLLAERVSPFCAFFTRDALDVIGSPDLEWYSDDLACYDLVDHGYTNWVSRAYVHHVGMRSSEGGVEASPRLNAEALAWLARHRPDFLAYLQAGRRRAVPAGG